MLPNNRQNVYWLLIQIGQRLCASENKRRVVYVPQAANAGDLCYSYNTGARDIWHIMHRKPEGEAPRAECIMCHVSRAHVL